MTNAMQRKSLTNRVIGISLLLAFGLAGYLLFTWISNGQDDQGLQSAFRSLALNIGPCHGSPRGGQVAWTAHGRIHGPKACARLSLPAAMCWPG